MDGDTINILISVVPFCCLQRGNWFLCFNVSGSILFKCMSLEADRITEQQEKVLSILEEKFPDLPPREEIISVLQETQFNPQGSATCFHFSDLLQIQLCNCIRIFWLIVCGESSCSMLSSLTVTCIIFNFKLSGLHSGSCIVISVEELLNS